VIFNIKLKLSVRQLLILVSTLLLYACSGESDEIISPQIDPVAVDSPVTMVSSSDIVITGAAAKGGLINATINLYTIDSQGFKTASSPVATTVTDTGGEFTLTIPPNSGALLIETSGGEFIDESDQEPDVNLKRRIQFEVGEGLTALLPENETKVAITLISQAILLQSRRDARSGDFLTVFASNQSAATSIYGFDPVTTIPADTINPDPAEGMENRQYALVLGGIANAINRISLELGVAMPTFEIILAVAEDLSDGNLNGLVDGGPIVLDVKGNGTLVSLPNGITLNSEINRFRNNNFTNFSSTTLIVVTETPAPTNASGLRVMGLVTGNTGLNAQVIISVAGQEFSTRTDVNGAYSIGISSDLTNGDQVVQITATGIEQNSPFKLISLLGSFNYVTTAAGSDSILTANELSAVNLSYVTTSITALMEDENNDQPIIDETEYNAALAAYDGFFVLDFATAIKLVIEYSDANPAFELPSNINDILELVRDLNAAKEYTSIAQSGANSETFEQAKSDIVSDEDIVSGGVDESVVSVVDNYYSDVTEGFLDFGRIILNSDGSGVVNTFNSEATFSWSRSTTGVDITYPNGGFVEYVYFRNVSINGVATQVQAESILTSGSISWISQTETKDHLINKATSYIHYPNAELPDEPPTSITRSIKAVKEAGLVSAANVLQMGVVHSMSIPKERGGVTNPKGNPVSLNSPEFENSSVKMVFSGSVSAGGTVVVSSADMFGDGSVVYTDETADWNIDANGHLILENFTGESAGVSADIAFVSANPGELPRFNMLVRENGVVETWPGTLMQKENVAWTSQNAVGYYGWYTNPFSSNNLAWIEVKNDGTFVAVNGYDTDDNGVLTSDEVELGNPGLWQVNSDGNLAMRKYQENVSTGTQGVTCLPSEFDPVDSANCVLAFEREWELFQITNSDKYYLVRTVSQYEDAYRSWMSDSSVVGHIVGGTSYLGDLHWLKESSSPFETHSNILPTSDAGLDQTVNGGEMVTLAGSGTDSDGSITRYLWSVASTTISFDDVTDPSTSFVAPTSGVTETYVLTLTVTDDSGATSSDEVVITVNSLNVAPVADAGADVSIETGASINLVGSGIDSDGTVVSYLWSQVSGSGGILSDTSSSTLSFTAPSTIVGSSEILTLRLTVTDDGGKTSSDEVLVTVNIPNTAPVADAGLDITTETNLTVSLVGTGADIDGTIIGYQWSQVVGSLGTLANDNTNTLTFTAPSTITGSSEVLTLRLTVTDDDGATHSDDVLVTVNLPNVAPVADAGADTSTNTGTTISLVGTGVDSDGTVVNYQWSQISGTNGVLSNETTSTLTFRAPSTIPVSSEILTLRLTITDDDGATHSDDVLVTVIKPNIAPVANAGADQNPVFEGETKTLVGTGSDSDGTVVSYLWTQPSGTLASLISPNSSTLTYIVPTPATQPEVLVFRLTVTDNDGATHSDLVNVTAFQGAR